MSGVSACVCSSCMSTWNMSTESDESPSSCPSVCSELKSPDWLVRWMGSRTRPTRLRLSGYRTTQRASCSLLCSVHISTQRAPESGLQTAYTNKRRESRACTPASARLACMLLASRAKKTPEGSCLKRVNDFTTEYGSRKRTCACE